MTVHILNFISVCTVSKEISKLILIGRSLRCFLNLFYQKKQKKVTKKTKKSYKNLVKFWSRILLRWLFLLELITIFELCNKLISKKGKTVFKRSNLSYLPSCKIQQVFYKTVIRVKFYFEMETPPMKLHPMDPIYIYRAHIWI